MKLSKETLALLKNFAGINSNLLLKDGGKLSTISAQKNIMASVSVAETFPAEFGIYDLNEFLGALSLFSDPDLTFSDKFVTIKEGGAHIKYYAADKSVLSYPQKEITFPSSDIDFALSSATLNQIIRTASVLRAPDLSIVGKNGKVTLVVGDRKNSTANTFDLEVGETDKTFDVSIKVENLKMIPGDYNVSVSSRKISRFQSSSSDTVYYVAVEADSTFE
jgi:hypothetical protein